MASAEDVYAQNGAVSQARGVYVCLWQLAGLYYVAGLSRPLQFFWRHFLILADAMCSFARAFPLANKFHLYFVLVWTMANMHAELRLSELFDA